MNEQWIIGGVNLAVLVYLLWRVWRLESNSVSEQRKVYDTVRHMMRTGDIGKASHMDVLDAELRMSRQVDRECERVFALAAALGYEWKSTPAKSGWEKRDSGPGCDHYNLLRHKVALYTSLDRRKADRRKPVDAPKKKPRRATH